ncbi:MAG: AMP-binding protein [Selenomonadaceae bacterium]|nr:AMP-binding protein [Selenomonadaceae bacterium]
MLVHNLIERGRAEDIAIVDAGRRITYADAAQSIKNFRNHMYALGIRQGDRIALFSRNSAEFIYTYLAAASLGAICVPINFQLSHRETAFILRDAEIKHILTYKPLELDEHFSDGVEVIQHDVKTFGEVDSDIDAPELPADFDANTPCAIIYTSGTTGNPKGAVLSHKNLVRNVEQIDAMMKCQRENKVLCVLPMYHCFGWTCCVLYTLYCGASIFVLRSFKHRETVDIIREEGLTDLYAVPSIYRLITTLGAPDDLKTVRLAMCSGTTLPLKVAKDFEEKFGIKLSEGYGLSEASPIVTLTIPGEEREGSIGKAIPDEILEVVDVHGNILPSGEVGELLVGGDNVFLGYWKNPAATAETIDAKGRLHTGDIVRIDADGYVFIVNRVKDMIISMGENIYPREVEEIIYKFDGIKDAAVVGVEDKLRGQAGACFYVVQDSVNFDIRELKKFLQKNLALYKIPREFHEVKDLPRTSTGKISKRKILEEFLGIKD